MKSLRMIAMGCISFCAGAAWAESTSQAFYRACLAEAGNDYAQCRYESRDTKGCLWAYRQEKDRCWTAFAEMGKSDPYYGWNGGAVRFEPVPIPQRPVYILPGMK